MNDIHCIFALILHQITYESFRKILNITFHLGSLFAFKSLAVCDCIVKSKNMLAVNSNNNHMIGTGVILLLTEEAGI